jgi:CRISPR-associated protein Csx3
MKLNAGVQMTMAQTTNRGVQFKLSRGRTREGLDYQVLAIELTRPDRLVSPEDLGAIELPPGIDTRVGVAIDGRGPIWLYGYLIHELHPTAWVACNDPRIGAIVVATHTKGVRVGQILQLGQVTDTLNPALMVVGPPDSGKSVFSHRLFQSLIEVNSNIYLQRANWDGEGNYTLELPPDLDAEGFKATNKGGLSDRFFPYHARAILELRRQKALTIVDVGGMVQPEKQPILEACTHYLIISSQRDAVDDWHEFCRDRGNLTPVAVIHSTLEEVEIVHQQQPFIEMTCGPWIRGQSRPIPQGLMERIQSLFSI